MHYYQQCLQKSKSNAILNTILSNAMQYKCNAICNLSDKCNTNKILLT